MFSPSPFFEPSPPAESSHVSRLADSEEIFRRRPTQSEDQGFDGLPVADSCPHTPGLPQVLAESENMYESVQA